MYTPCPSFCTLTLRVPPSLIPFPANDIRFHLFLSANSHAARNLPALPCCSYIGSFRHLCNQFVQDVARNLGIALPGPAAYGKADDIVAALRLNWASLTRHEAILVAGKGAFIVAGLASTKFNWRPLMNRHQAQFAGNQKQFSGPAVAGVEAPITESGQVCVVIPGAFTGYPRVFSSNAEPGTYGRAVVTTRLPGMFSRTRMRPRSNTTHRAELFSFICLKGPAQCGRASEKLRRLHVGAYLGASNLGVSDFQEE